MIARGLFVVVVAALLATACRAGVRTRVVGGAPATCGAQRAYAPPGGSR